MSEEVSTKVEPENSTTEKTEPTRKRAPTKPRQGKYWLVKAVIYTSLFLISPLISFTFAFVNQISATQKRTNIRRFVTTLSYLDTVPYTGISIVGATSDCPNGYFSFGRTGLIKSETDEFTWPGSKEGQVCNRTIGQSCAGDLINVPSLDPVPLNVWKGNKICWQRGGVPSPHRPEMVNGQCPDGHKVCGSICQQINVGCPLTSFYLTNNATNGILFDAQNKKYLVVGYGGIERPIIDFDLTVAYSKIERGWNCRTEYRADIERAENCINDTYPQDFRFINFDSIPEKQLFKDNSIPEQFGHVMVTFQLNYIRELEWNSTGLTKADVMTLYYPTGIMYFVFDQLIGFSIFTFVVNGCIAPIIQILTGKWFVWWCVHRLTYSLLVIINVIDTTVRFVRVCVSFIALTYSFTLFIIVSFFNILDRLENVETDATTYDSMLVVRAYVREKLGAWAIISFLLSLLLTITSIIGIFFSILFVIRYIIRYCNAKRQLAEDALNPPEEEELHDVSVKDVEVIKNQAETSVKTEQSEQTQKVVSVQSIPQQNVPHRQPMVTQQQYIQPQQFNQQGFSNYQPSVQYVQQPYQHQPISQQFYLYQQPTVNYPPQYMQVNQQYIPQYQPPIQSNNVPNQSNLPNYQRVESFNQN